MGPRRSVRREFINTFSKLEFRWTFTLATLVDQLTYAYPGGSNRLSSVTDAIAPTSETWDAETGSLTYDANGNLLTAPGPYAITATTYDAWNRRLSLTRAGTTSTYRYAAGGQRLAKQVGGGSAEVYITDGPTTLAVFTVPASGTPSAWHFNLLAGDRIVGRQPSVGSRLYYHRDRLNSTRAVVTGTTVVESRDYDPWGVELAGRTLGSGTKEGFTGQERDAESGLDAFWARAYLPVLGRWGSADPLRDSFPEWNPYNYVRNDPVTFDDPVGLCPVCVIAYAAFELGATAYDLYDLAKTALRANRGEASSAEVAVTAAGVAIGVWGAGGGYGKASREAIEAGLRGATNVAEQVAYRTLSDGLGAGKGVVIAGAGAKDAFRGAANYAAKNGGDAADYVKKSTVQSVTTANGTKTHQIHWVENIRTGRIYDSQLTTQATTPR